MALRISTDSDEITALLATALRVDPVRHTIFGTIAAALASERADGWCAFDGSGNIAVRSQPITPLALAGGWTPIEPLVDAVAALEMLTAIGGPVAVVESLTAALAHCGHADADRYAARSLSTGRPWLWLDPSNCPVAMALGHAPSFGAARVGPVYTPRKLRGHGYGSAVTAAASQDILDCGAVPVLYTDLSNQTSNKIYQRLGYYAVEDRLQVEFS